MSLSPVIDGLSDPFKSKPIAFFAPTKLGTSAFAAKREIASVMKIYAEGGACLLYTSPSPRDLSTSRMPSSA